jgi:hypothetical protein
MLVIPATWEVKVGGLRLRLASQKAPGLKNSKKGWWHDSSGRVLAEQAQV